MIHSYQSSRPTKPDCKIVYVIGSFVNTLHIILDRRSHDILFVRYSQQICTLYVVYTISSFPWRRYTSFSIKARSTLSRASLYLAWKIETIGAEKFE